MRLLKTSNVQLENFPDDRNIPHYAILSHTWEAGEEVLFADMGDSSTAATKAGYNKLRYSCKQAMADGFEYIWIDTCCIDKSSSAELSESINSMYSWYHRAEKCYVYLADFPSKVQALVESRWFTRGWTLQELIAPPTVIFYSSDWVEVGTKLTLYDSLAKRTGIDVSILTGKKTLESASVARRMSWACNRETTRTEDEAYCLMGLFDVNMPMLYGEGPKAFIRLQEEIMKNSDDQSLFAWTESTADPESYHELLAKSPRNFANTGNIFPYRDWGGTAPFSISNKGLRIDLHLSRYQEDLYIAALDCPAPPTYEGFLGIHLKRIATGDRQFARVKSRNLCKLNERANAETIYVRQSPTSPGPQDIYPLHVFQLRRRPTSTQGLGYTPVQAADASGYDKSVPVFEPYAIKRWPLDMQTNFKITKCARQLAGAILFERHDGERLVVLLGSMTEFTVGFNAVTLSNVESINLLQQGFKPQPPGTNMVLEDHHVRVNTEQRVDGGVKYYLVDIVIEARYRLFNTIDMLMDVVPALQNEPGKRSDNTGAVPPIRGHG